ncbi:MULTISPECIES: carotenoid oxygenase family protein [unclassified Streptomyces]|uniref:carotenoid oxygenase family protein n=1 Tax=unclassified Streptomyces TaxID=2593676 RepID=UPI0030834E83
MEPIRVSARRRISLLVPTVPPMRSSRLPALPTARTHRRGRRREPPPGDVLTLAADGILVPALGSWHGRVAAAPLRALRLTGPSGGSSPPCRAAEPGRRPPSLDDLPVEFPTLDERYLRAEIRYPYAVSFPDEQGYGGYGVVRYDRTTGARRIHRAGYARLPSEAVFVPAEGATREDDGYLLTMVCDLKQDASQLLVLDASGLDLIATVHLPHRVTAGIHGSRVPDDAGKDSEI